ncbi:GNAT family N-acetyltransferase [Nonomuraea longispora]|uniref:GNAT family N-acetyltransferase n=1 Tax=Nonomuraea longispora TaxID=1848320 RepID=UPI003CCC5261
MFLDHFHRTSLVAEGPGGMAGFLIGFVSPSQPREAYIHFVGVAPAARKSGLARSVYERFFGIARDHGRHVVRAVTAPVNSAPSPPTAAWASRSAALSPATTARGRAWSPSYARSDLKRTFPSLSVMCHIQTVCIA